MGGNYLRLIVLYERNEFTSQHNKSNIKWPDCNIVKTDDN